jgi:predicted permease
MSILRRFLARLWNFASARRADARLREEMEYHLALQAEENHRAGMPVDEARRQAVLRLGAQQAIRESYHAEESLPLIENLLRDLRYGCRRLAHTPGFTLVTVLVLAVGIGALTTVATWTNAVLYNPWPQVNSPRQVRFIDATVLGNQGYSVHYDQFRFLHTSGRSWQNAIAFAQTTVNLAPAGARPEAIPVGLVTSNYFSFLGIAPQLGAQFTANDDERRYGSSDQVLLSDALWRDRFHADPSIVGRTISVGGHPFTVVGVAPRNFAGIFGGVAEVAWIPLSGLRDLSADSGPDPLPHYGLQVAVRLRPGLSDSTAASELHTLARSFAAQNPDRSLSRWDLNLRDAAHFSRGLFNAIGGQLPILIGASSLLLALVVINIASLLGQHTARRRREVAIRTSLGATPARIATQVLTEAALLALAGGIAGWAASFAMARSLYILLPDFGVPLAFNLRPDGHVLLFVTALTTVVAVACGMYPVRQALHISQNEALRAGGTAVTGPARRALGRQVLLGLQLGVCFIVLVGCGLLTRTAWNIAHRGTGFDPANCMTAQLALSRAGYTSQRGLAFQARLLERLRALPGVSAATLTSHLPMGGDGSGNTQDFSIPGYVPARGEAMAVITDFEGPGFFRTMGIALRAGREFDEHDNPASADVAVINEVMAKRYWPRGNALGSSVVVDKRPRRIVGVIGDYLYSDPADTDPAPLLFLPLQQNYWSDVILAMRSRTTAAALTAQLRQAIAELDTNLPLESLRPLDQVVGERYQMMRLPAELLGVYAVASISVAIIGLYAVMAYSVLERHREFALRVALGSTRAAIFRLVLSGSAWTAAVGLLSGSLGSVAFVRLLRSLLFGVTAFDPFSYSAAVLLLLGTIAGAVWMPARRAAGVEPMQVLRSD